MKNRTGITCLRILLAASLSIATAFAQGQTPPQENPQLQANPLDTLRNFEPAADEEYRLGKGDEITVDFAGRSDLQAKLVIGPDGRVTLPLAGDVTMSGTTRTEAAQAVANALAGYYTNLSVQVTVTKYTANRILLLGSVEHPGILTFDGTPTLLEALTRGGIETGSGTGIGSTTTTVKTSQIPDRCAIYRGQNEVVWVDLKSLLESGNALADLRLRRDDVIYVPNMAERFVSVLGQVVRPGAIQLTTNATLASILAGAGGFTAQAGNMPHIQIVDPASGTSRIVSFKDVLRPTKSLEVTLRAGEIIYVPQTGFSRATYALERLNPLITAATFGIISGGLL
jgi:polysaccharide export outer membrane protein